MPQNTNKERKVTVLLSEETVSTSPLDLAMGLSFH